MPKKGRKATRVESPGDRWTVVEAKPGKPFAYLDGDQSSGAAYLVEVTSDQGETHYQAFTADGKRHKDLTADGTQVTQWPTAAAAARGMEKSIDQHRARPRARSEFVQEMRRQRGQCLTPDWKLYQRMHKVRIWVGVALSLDIDPRMVNREHRDSQEFKDRLLLATERFDCNKESKVELSNFAAWAKSVGLEIPRELAALAGPDQRPPRDDGEAEQADLRKPTRRRRDILTPIIDEAIAQTDGTTPEVWVHVRDRAVDGTPPFTGHVDALGLDYTNAKNEVRKFTRKQLGQRLSYCRNSLANGTTKDG